jgi:hypothetical protein
MSQMTQSGIRLRIINFISYKIPWKLEIPDGYICIITNKKSASFKKALSYPQNYLRNLF